MRGDTVLGTWLPTFQRIGLHFLVCVTLEDEGTAIIENPENHLLATQCHVTEDLNLRV